MPLRSTGIAPAMSTFRPPPFLPEDLRQLLQFVPSRGWDALEWTPLISSLRSVAWRFASGSGVLRLTAAVRAAVPSIRFATPPRGARPLEALQTDAQRQVAGDRILELYFRQWLVEDGLFIDLRPARFRMLSPDLYFRPNGLWIQLRPGFRRGVVDLYRAFYSDDEAGLRAALVELGMLRPGLSDEAEAELLELLRVHFGIEQGAQHFSIDRFRQSFNRLFDFFIAHGYRLHSDFVFLGFYLITLYQALESLGQAHDVRRIGSRALLDDAGRASAGR